MAALWVTIFGLVAVETVIFLIYVIGWGTLLELLDAAFRKISTFLWIVFVFILLAFAGTCQEVWHMQEKISGAVYDKQLDRQLFDQQRLFRAERNSYLCLLCIILFVAIYRLSSYSATIRSLTKAAKSD